LHILFIKKFRMRLVLFFTISFLWIAFIMVFNLLIRNNLVHNITINNYVSFSYPYSFEVDNIFVNQFLDENIIQTNSSEDIIYARKFSSYSSIAGNFSFIYPSVFTLNQKQFAGTDILYHIDFTDNAMGSYGFVQVWNMPYDLKVFLENSKAASQIDFEYFNFKPLSVNNLEGYLWDYAFIAKNASRLKGSEAFLKKEDRMYRISFFVPEKKWNKMQSGIFMKMVNSFKVY
jgi:hypothetical protein